MLTRLTPKSRLTYLLIRACDPENVQPRLVRAIDKGKTGKPGMKLNYKGAVNWLRKTYVQDDYPDRLLKKFTDFKQSKTQRIPEFSREWRELIIKLKSHGRTYPKWQRLKLFLDAIRPEYKLKLEKATDFKSVCEGTDGLCEMAKRALAIEKHTRK